MGQVLNTKNAHATHVLAASTGVTWGPGRVHSKPGLLVRYTWNSKSASLPLGASHIQSHVPCRVNHFVFIFYYVEDSLTWYCSEVAVAYDKSGGCQQSSASASCSLVASCTNCIDILGGTLLPNKQTKNRNKTKQNNTAATAVRSTWNLPCFTTNLRECKTDWLKSGENHQTQTCSTDVTGTHQRRPESPTAALTWQASKYQRLGSLTVCI